METGRLEAQGRADVTAGVGRLFAGKMPSSLGGPQSVCSEGRQVDEAYTHYPG